MCEMCPNQEKINHLRKSGYNFLHFFRPPLRNSGTLKYKDVLFKCLGPTKIQDKSTDTVLENESRKNHASSHQIP
jgi:hypothetical protein